MIIQTNIAPYMKKSLDNYLDGVELCQFRIKVMYYEVVLQRRIKTRNKCRSQCSNNLIGHLHVLLQYSKIHY